MGNYHWIKECELKGMFINLSQVRKDDLPLFQLYDNRLNPNPKWTLLRMITYPIYL
jgi:hypothetical protein